MPKVEPVFLKIVITADVADRIKNFKENWKGEEIKEVIVRVQTEDGHAYETGGDMIEFLKRMGLEEPAKKLFKDNA